MEMEHPRSYDNPAPVLATEVLEKHDNTSPNTATPLGPPDEAFEGLATLIQVEQPVSPDLEFEFASPTLYDASSGSSAVSEHSGASDVDDYDFASLGAFFDWPPNGREETMAAASISAAATASGAVADESTGDEQQVGIVQENQQSPVANNETEDYDVEQLLEDMLAASGCVVDQNQPAPALDDSNEGFLTDEQFAQWMMQQAAAEHPVDVQANGNGSPVAFEHDRVDETRPIRPLPTRRPRVGVEWYGADATVEVAGEREQPTYGDEVAQAGPSHVAGAPTPACAAAPPSGAYSGGSPPHQQSAGPVAHHYPQLQAAQQPGYPWPYPPVQNAYYPYPAPAPANGTQESANVGASASGNQLPTYPPLPNPAPYYPYAAQPQPPIRSLAEFYQQPGRLLSSEPVSHHMTPYQNGMPPQGPVAGPSYPYPYPYPYPHPYPYPYSMPQPAGSASKRKADSDVESTGRRPGRPKKQPKLDAVGEALSRLTPANLQLYTECKTLRAGKHLLVCPLEGHDRYGAFSNDVEGIREHLHKAHGHEDWEQVKLRRRGHGGVKTVAVVCDWPDSDSATGTGTGTCGAHFDGAAKYIRHLQSEHLKDTYYRCPNVQKPSCNMTFKKKEDLAVHMAICQAEVEAEREERRRKEAARIWH